MIQFEHDFGWQGICIYCGVTQEAVEDNVASPNCDIVRQRSDKWTTIIVAIGIAVCAIPLIGLLI